MAWKIPHKPGQWSLTLAFLIVGVAMMLVPREWSRYRTAANQVDRSRQILTSSEAFLSSLKDAEIGQRGYLLTRNPKDLRPYRQTVSSIPFLLTRLGQISRGRPALQSRFSLLNNLTEAKLQEMERSLVLARTAGLTAAQKDIQSGRGRYLMDQIRHAVADIERQQSNDLTDWSLNSDKHAHRTLGFGAVGLVLLLLFLLNATRLAWRARERELSLIEHERESFNALQESEARFRVVADSAPVLVWTAGTDRRRDYVNKVWLQFTGRPVEEELGEGWTQAIQADDLPGYTRTFGEAFDGRRPFRIEYRLRRHDGAYRWIEDHGVPRYLPNGEFAGYIGSCVDIQDRKTMEAELEERVHDRTEQLRFKEEELMQSRKIEAIGRLAGGVAHDFNNMITGIIGLTEEVRGDLPPKDPHQKTLSEIMKAAQRASSLTKQLLAFGRRQIISPRVLDLNASLTEMSSMLKRLIGEDIQLSTVLAPELGHVRMDPGQVEQVIVNLILNARDAMPSGGKIVIETVNVDLDASYSKTHFAIRPGAYVLLTISDTGEGMNQATLEHIFEPFFTTKDKTKGSGMGLATVYGIVKQNSGDIYVYSTPGAGTTFKIYIPRTSDPVAATPEPRPAESHHGTETILLVEDEAIVRRVANRALTHSGFKVLEARNGKEALEIAAQHNGRIALMLTDVIMPGLNGRQLAEMLTQQRPEMKVLFTSGYTEDIIVQRGLLKPGIAFIEKSFTATSISAKVREVLDSPVGSLSKTV
jgi:two-component system cell cycle sensor histidine kinase/response regulator CckA